MREEKSGGRLRCYERPDTSMKYYIVHINQIFSIQTEVAGASRSFFAAHHIPSFETTEEAQRNTPYAIVIDHTN